jgi:hypothetical protein
MFACVDMRCVCSRLSAVFTVTRELSIDLSTNRIAQLLGSEFVVALVSLFASVASANQPRNHQVEAPDGYEAGDGRPGDFMTFIIEPGPYRRDLNDGDAHARSEAYKQGTAPTSYRRNQAAE